MKRQHTSHGRLLATLTILLAGCVTSGPRLMLDTVGPTSGGALPKSPHGDGFLEVFTDTDTVNSGGISYYPHSGYELTDDAGKPVRFVRNRGGNTDESPESVRLPVGRYHVIARCPGYGMVEIPVIVVRQDVTVVNLENRGHPPATDGIEVVRLPNGWPVGRRAEQSGKR